MLPLRSTVSSREMMSSCHKCATSGGRQPITPGRAQAGPKGGRPSLTCPRPLSRVAVASLLRRILEHRRRRTEGDVHRLEPGELADAIAELVPAAQVERRQPGEAEVI